MFTFDILTQKIRFVQNFPSLPWVMWKARKTIKSTVLDLRNQLSDWIRPSEEDHFNQDDYAYECSDSEVDDFPDDVDTDDKSYPPETE